MKSKTRFFDWHRHVFAVALLFLLFQESALSQTTAFTYQGKLTDGGNPASGNYDLQFALFDNVAGGTQIGSTLTRANTSVSTGIFTVQLDFGVNAFPGASRFLEIRVRPAGVGSFTLLDPRLQISSTPYAIRTLSAAIADTANNSTQLGGIAANQYVQTDDSRLSDARSPIPGSSNYIQNTNSAQSANYNISGTGTLQNLFASGNVNIGTTLATARLNVRLEVPGNCNVVDLSWGPPAPSCGNVLAIGSNGPATNLIHGFGAFGTVMQVRPDGSVLTNGSVGVGTLTPARTLHVNGRARVNLIPPEPSTASVCFNGAGDLLQCGSSSLKLKTNISAFRSGLDVIRGLNPISFDWKDGSGHDIGLGAEDVAEVAPSLVFKNAKGDVSGVKYERLNMLFINAIKEQQQQIEIQHKQIAQILTANTKLKLRLRALENGRKRKRGQVRS